MDGVARRGRSRMGKDEVETSRPWEIWGVQALIGCGRSPGDFRCQFQMIWWREIDWKGDGFRGGGFGPISCQVRPSGG